MDWDTYYEKFYDWATSTQISRMSSLTSFGDSSEIAEVAQEYMDEAAASRLIKKAVAYGIQFTAEEIYDLSCCCNQEAMNVLNSLGQKNGEWYYLAAMANMGLGNNVTALDQIREAVRQEPDNVQYRMILQRMEGGGGWYQQQQDPFGGMPTAGGDMCDACCRTMACAMCWPGGIFCC